MSRARHAASGARYPTRRPQRRGSLHVTHIVPRYVHVLQVGGSSAFERLAPTREELTSAKSAREEKREARELDGMTFKPQLLAAANDATRRMQIDSPPGLAKHVARMVPDIATIRYNGAAGGGLGASDEAAPSVAKLTVGYRLQGSAWGIARLYEAGLRKQAERRKQPNDTREV